MDRQEEVAVVVLEEVDPGVQLVLVARPLGAEPVVGLAGQVDRGALLPEQLRQLQPDPEVEFALGQPGGDPAGSAGVAF